MQRCRIFEKMARVFFIFIILFLFYISFYFFFIFIYYFIYHFIFIFLFFYFYFFIFFILFFLSYVIDENYSKDFFFGLVNGRQWRHVDLVTRCKWKAQKKNCLLFQRWHGERSVSMENQKKKRWISWFIRVWGAFCVVALFCFTRSASFLIMKRNFFYSGGWKRKLRWKYLTHQKGNVWPILVAKKKPLEFDGPRVAFESFPLEMNLILRSRRPKISFQSPPGGTYRLVTWCHATANHVRGLWKMNFRDFFWK